MWQDVEFVAGFHSLEQDDLGPFIWSTGTFCLRFAQPGRLVRFKLCYYGLEGELAFTSGDHVWDTVTLTRGWHACYVDLRGLPAGQVVECRLLPVIAVAGDTRELGLMFRECELSDDPADFDMRRQSQRNLWLNQQEFRQGLAVLSSTPPALRLTLETRCNIPETSQACVYCPWDWAKLAERGAPRVTVDTLTQLGSFYQSATEVVDCSVGEPTMHKELGPYVARLDHDGKQLSLVTNGQLLTPRIRRELLGKNLELYVSVDAPTAAGYARLRNDRFEDVVANVTALCQEKRSHGDLPKVYLACIVMRSTWDELAEMFLLAQRVGVDVLKLRPLNLDENVPQAVMNNGLRFDYADEVLGTAELAELSDRAAELSVEHGVKVYVESEEFPLCITEPDAPICNEPWRTMYVLSRGIMPCCYATEPLARWSEQGDRSLEQFLRDVFNGSDYQEIRRELAAGRLSDYCQRTASCPIVKQRRAQGQLEAPANVFQLAAERPGARRLMDQSDLPLVSIDRLVRV